MSTADHFQRYTPRLLGSWSDGEHHRAIPGTMVFCDISGFTALSERLAKKGRVGSEEVAAALTKVFSELLDIALGRGGDLLKFGGDALLLLFTGSDHCSRAAASAFEMKQRLKKVGRIDTGSGKVILDMTVGVNTGTFDMFVVGDRHGELIVAGADASGTVRAEESSDKGQITVTAAVAEQIDSTATRPKGDGRYLLVAAPSAATPPDPVARTNDRLDLHVPTALRPVVGTPASDGEHRRAVIAFMKFKGTDGAIIDRGAEAVWADLDATVRIAQAATDEFGVTFLSSDIDVDGGKIILIAGTPTTTDNDTERLLRALRRIEEAEPPLPLKIGVNTGTLFAGDVGSSTRAAYTVIGDPVNLAARLMGKAEPGQILAENLVLERSETIFETTPVEPFFVKGKTEAVQAVVVGPVAGVRADDSTGDTPMLGRADVLDEILADYASASTTTARLVDLVGPAGIGKTRLLTAARHLPESGDWIKIDCERYEESTSYYALRILVRWLLGVPDDADDRAVGSALRDAAADSIPSLQPWVPLVADAIGADVPATPEVDALDDKFRKERTHDAILRLVDALTPRPAALLFDNAQWLDENSREVITGAQTFSDALPWLICLSRRETGEPPDSTTQIELGPLSHDDSIELAHLVAAEHPLPHHRILEIVERSGGNPIFLISLVEAAIDGGELPANVEDLINARIDGLDQEARKVLRCAAVIGGRFRIDLLETCIGDETTDLTDPELWARLDEYIERLPNGDHLFRQNLHRDVAYTGLPYHLRKELHLRIGEALEAENAAGSPELLARHFQLAESHERAWTYAVIAGDQAAAKFNHIDAADLYRLAIAAVRHVDDAAAGDIVRIHEALGLACETAGLYDEADIAYGRARKLAHRDPVACGRLLRRQGLLRELSGNYSVALRWLTRGLKALDVPGADGDAAHETTRVLLSYAGVRYRQGHYQHCIDRCRDALAVPAIAPGEAAHAHYLLCLAFAHLGDPASEDEGTRALAFYDAAGDQLGRANVLNNLGMNAYYRGNWDESIDFWSRSGEAREACGDIVGAATQTNNLGEIYSDQGKWDDARVCFTEALRIWQGARYGVGIALAKSNLGRVEARSGNHRAAEQLLDEAIDGFEEIGAGAFAVEARIRRAENLLLSDDPGAVQAALDLVPGTEGTPGTIIPQAILYRILGSARRAAGDIDGAEEALRTSLDRAVAADAPFQRAQTLAVMASVRDAEPDEEAAAIFERLGVVGTVDAPWDGLAIPA